MFNITCKQCGGSFQAKRSTAKFCSSACRVAFKRDQEKKITETTKAFVKHKRVHKKEGTEETLDVKVDYQPGFTPNWKKKGFKNKEEAIAHIFNCLHEKRKKILSKGVSEETPILWGNKIFRLTKKGFKV